MAYNTVPDSGQPNTVTATPPQALLPQSPVPDKLHQSFGSKIGSVAHAILGGIEGYQTTTQVNPQTQQLETKPIPDPNNPGQYLRNRPGQIFRNILAGALLGGAAATEAHSRNPWIGGGGGAAIGAGAEVQDIRNQQLLKNAQAERDFERKQQVGQQEEQNKQRDMELQARTAEWNFRQLDLNRQIQGQSFNQHMELVQAGKTFTAPLDAAGIRPSMTMTETQAAQEMQKDPSFFYKYHAVPMDIVQTGTGKDGSPKYEMRYGFYDINKDINIPAGWIDQMKKLGIETIYPNFGDVMKGKKSLTVDQFSGIMSQVPDLIKMNILGKQAIAAQEQANASRLNAVAQKMRAQAEKIATGENVTEAQRKRDIAGAYDVFKSKFDTMLSANPNATQAEAIAALNPQQRANLREWAQMAMGDAIKQYDSMVKALPKGTVKGSIDEQPIFPSDHNDPIYQNIALRETIGGLQSDLFQLGSQPRQPVVEGKGAKGKPQTADVNMISQAQRQVNWGSVSNSQVPVLDPKTGQIAILDATLAQEAINRGAVRIPPPRPPEKPRQSDREAMGAAMSSTVGRGY